MEVKVAGMRIVLIALSLALAAASPRAQTREFSVLCFGTTSPAPNTDGYAEVTEKNLTSASPAFHDVGLLFNGTSDEEAVCPFIVPDDYDADSATESSVVMAAFQPDCVTCIPGLTCALTRYVQYKFSAKRVAPGSTVYQAWGAETSDSSSFTSQTCGSPCSTNCYPAGRLDTYSGDATDDASNWNIGDLVQIRVKRDTGVSGNLTTASQLVGSHLKLTIPVQ